MTNKPSNITSFIKKRDIKIAKEILEKEFELMDLIDSAGNDPEYDLIHAKVRGGFFKTLEGNALGMEFTTKGPKHYEIRQGRIRWLMKDRLKLF